MRIISRDILYLYLILWYGVTGNDVTSCNKTISIQCEKNHYQIVIRNINSTSDTAQDLLEKCNAHPKCQVTNGDNECFQLRYWCRMNFPTLEVKVASTVQLATNISMVSLMSENYKDGYYPKASNINCELQFDEQGNQMENRIENKMNVMFTVHEIAPFSESRKFCLHVTDSQGPLICSGAGKLHTSYGPFYRRSGLQFSFTLAKTATTSPKVRFWLDIVVSPDEVSISQLECSSQPVSDESGQADPDEQIFKRSHIVYALRMVVVILLALLFTVVILTLVTVLRCRQRRQEDATIQLTSSAEDTEDYLDMDHTYFQAEAVRMAPSLPPLPRHRNDMSQALQEDEQPDANLDSIDDCDLTGDKDDEMEDPEQEENEQDNRRDRVSTSNTNFYQGLYTGEVLSEMDGNVSMEQCTYAKQLNEERMEPFPPPLPRHRNEMSQALQEDERPDTNLDSTDDSDLTGEHTEVVQGQDYVYERSDSGHVAAEVDVASFREYGNTKDLDDETEHPTQKEMSSDNRSTSSTSSYYSLVESA